MSIEEIIRKLILQRYGTLRAFTKEIGMAQSTFATIMKRGIHNASIDNVLKICNALEISADALAEDKIVSLKGNAVAQRLVITDIPEQISFVRENMSEYDDFTIDNQPLSEDEWLIILNGLTVSVEFIRQQRKSVLFIREPRRFERCDY